MNIPYNIPYLGWGGRLLNTLVIRDLTCWCSSTCLASILLWKTEIADLCVHIVIFWLKQKGKKVQDPVHITSNWNNVLYNTLANPLIPGRWVSWESSFSSWWDNKIWSPFWYSFLCQTLPETTHAANWIVRCWIRACCLFWRPFSKSPLSGKMIGFFTERRKSSGYQLWVCQLEKALSPLLIFQYFVNQGKWRKCT